MFEGCVFEITKEQQTYQMRVRLPMLDRSKMRIRNTGSELVLQLENQRRIISLPAAMIGYRPVKANYEKDYLLIQFSKPDKKADTPDSPKPTEIKELEEPVAVYELATDPT